ncbi:Low-specificity L-threonine aldolase [Lachnospiraceae bacterium TWA4]|nr:Low-specificity L-threonine aldolase [Lachnospiraceae bacterium TWA4]
MVNLRNDYSEGVHPLILEALIKSTYEQNFGYGLDSHCQNATELFKQLTENDAIDVHFFSGGTAVNKTVISYALRPWEAVICADTGHINVHETGAIEALGHKVLTAPNEDGKLTPAGIEKVLREHSTEHMVLPAMVYISNSTELGSIYTKKELIALHELCHKYNLYLYLDGARLSNAMASPFNDITFKDLATYTDIFYFGGTKNGAMGAEACIIVNPHLKRDFRFAMKQNGLLAAKGFILGIQFETLCTDNLYLELASHANQMAARLSEFIGNYDYQFLTATVTNQLFPILPNEMANKLAKEVDFEVWGTYDENHTVIRLVTSWATTNEQVEAFKEVFIKIEGEK